MTTEKPQLAVGPVRGLSEWLRRRRRDAAVKQFVQGLAEVETECMQRLERLDAKLQCVARGEPVWVAEVHGAYRGPEGMAAVRASCGRRQTPRTAPLLRRKRVLTLLTTAAIVLGLALSFATLAGWPGGGA